MASYKNKSNALEEIIEITSTSYSSYKDLSVETDRRLISAVSNYFKYLCLDNGYPEKKITALRTKLRDAGRRSAPWKPTSSRVPGRPQDGSDGNRINRWLLPPDHKFYADEETATAVEIKYYLQLLSMKNAPKVDNRICNSFSWLLSFPIEPGNYKDPIQLIDIDFNQVIHDARIIQSGHIDPLDRDGSHTPENTFLMLYRSNQLQGNLKVNELLDLMRDIIKKHEDINK